MGVSCSGRRSPTISINLLGGIGGWKAGEKGGGTDLGQQYVVEIEASNHPTLYRDVSYPGMAPVCTPT